MREIEKLMLAMGGEAVAFKGINDFYDKRLVEREMTRFGFPGLMVRSGVAIQNVLARLRLMGYGMGCVVVFKATPLPSELEALEGVGFSIERLSVNPYVS